MTNEVQPNHLLFSAPTSAGKGVALVIPDDWDGPVVIFDPKSTLPDQGGSSFDPQREGRPEWKSDEGGDQ